MKGEPLPAPGDRRNHGSNLKRKGCFHCGGDLYRDGDGYTCLLCGRSQTSVEGLTSTEAEILAYLARGFTHRKAAAALHFSEAMLQKHLTRAMGKLKARNTTHAVALALKHNLIGFPD